jgi:hypothetical protein
MSEAARRLHLRFSILNPEHIKAYETISAIPSGQRTEYICRLINRESRLNTLEQRVIKAVSAVLTDFQPQINPMTGSNSEEKIPQNMMDFLHSL